MSFRSEKQKKFMFAKRPKIAKKWAAEKQQEFEDGGTKKVKKDIEDYPAELVTGKGIVSDLKKKDTFENKIDKLEDRRIKAKMRERKEGDDSTESDRIAARISHLKELRKKR